IVKVPIDRLCEDDQRHLLSLNAYRDYFLQNPIEGIEQEGSEMAHLSAPKNFTHGEIRRFNDMGWGVTSLAFAPQKAWLAVGKQDSVMLLFDVEKSKLMTALKGLSPLGQVSCICFSPDGTRLVAGGSTGRILVWEVNASGQLKPLSQFVAHNDDIQCLQVSPDGKHVLSGGNDKTLFYWELETGKEVYAFQEFNNSVKSCFITPKGHQAMACDTATLVLFDLKTGKSIEQINIGGRTSSQAAAISPDGRRVGYSYTYAINQFDIRSGEGRPVLQDREIQWTMTYSPDGKFVASGGREKVNIWNANTGRRIHVVDLSSSGYVKCVAFSPDGKHIASIGGNAGQSLQVFRLPDLDD
ncbi:MAG: WD40 repeat domain-containing protein, partial [bacterium]|nr:WD40 repeat domain-containing protein [bacterium]